MEYQVTMTPQATEQVCEIGQYIAHTLQEPQTSKRWLDLLYKEIFGLRAMPCRYPLTEEEPWHTKGIRKMTVENFLVYYFVDEDNRIVSVLAVVYGKRDQLAVLKDLMQNAASSAE